MPPYRAAFSPWPLLVAAMVLTAFVYWPSLRGGYVFDDYPNILQNRDVHLDSLNWESLRRAALSSPSPVLIRPISMLSFAIDWYAGGGDPFEMKLVNLAIHLVNGLLLFGLLRRIVRPASVCEASGAADRGELLALCVTSAWLLAPINFTAVGYIVQRMESLAQLFVLAGLDCYVAARLRMLAGRPGFLWAAAALVFGSSLGVLAKESAILLPLYAFVLEWALLGFRARESGPDRRLLALYAFVLLIPGCIAAGWALSHALPAGAWINRPFTLAERLLTEPRILLDYVRWSLLPTPNALALYHDQIVPSTGLLSPWTTLASIVALAAAVGVAVRFRRTRPLAAIGILWFLAGHLLTGTFIPLELVFEHRNYFSSIGLYLLVFSLLLPGAHRGMNVARSAACIGLIVLFASVTWVRALDWSNPVTFATSEVEKNPDSPRTAYELGRTYVILSHYEAGSPLVPMARGALERAASMPGAGTLPDQGLLMLSARMHEPTSPDVWQRMQRKLAKQPLSAQDISALYSLGQCAIDGDCALPEAQMVASFVAALNHPSPDSRVLSIYANYAINVLHDANLAIDLAQDSMARTPRDLQARRNLLLLLQSAGRHDDAMALYRKTLLEMPDAARDRAFREWSERLLNAPVPGSPPASVPQQSPQ
jgi:hypothetical protein